MLTKCAARTVIFDQDNLFALISVRHDEYFKIPGGGIENNENQKQAAVREALEETGCEIKIIQKIGENKFTDKNIIYHSICFLAQKIRQIENPVFDDWEKFNSMKTIWVNINQAINLFKNAKPADDISKKINQRDFNFVLQAKQILNL